MLDNIDSISTKQTVLGGDLNFQFELLLETKTASCNDNFVKGSFWFLWYLENKKSKIYDSHFNKIMLKVILKKDFSSILKKIMLHKVKWAFLKYPIEKLKNKKNNFYKRIFWNVLT